MGKILNTFLLGVGLVAITYFGYPKLREYFEFRDYGYTKPSEITKKLVFDENLNNKIKQEIEVYNQAVKDKKPSKLKKLILGECGDISKSKADECIESFISNNSRMELEYVLKKDTLRVGVSVRDDDSDSADTLYGTSEKDLHFKCFCE